MSQMDVVFLGTSSATPTRTRRLPSLAIRREGEVFLMDCGEGAQTAFAELGLGLNREMTILITHLHGDHVNGLLGLIQTMSMAQRQLPLTIVGPTNVFEWLKATVKLLHIGLSFDLRFSPAKPGVVVRGRDYRIRCARAKHSVEAWSYLFEELPRPGIFDPRKATDLGIPEGKKWSSLQHGKTVIVNGRKVRPSEVLGPKRPGRRVGYSGDTRPSSELVRFFSGADVLIFDSTFSSEDVDKAVERKHSTSAEAATVAKRAKAKRLVITHFSARYRNSSRQLRQARAVFPNTLAAHDGLVVEVPRRE